MINTNLTLDTYLANSTKNAVVDPTDNQAAKAVIPTSTDTGSSFDPAVNLDLSEEAKKILAQLQQQQQQAQDEPVLKQPFKLSDTQTKQITDIVQSFKDEPITQETFQKINDALQDAGLGSDKLAVLNSAASFNSTSFLASLLSGNSQNTPSLMSISQNMSNMQEKQSEYLQGIYDYWQATTTQTSEEGTGAIDG
jgi:hypothetical protein